MTGRPSSYSDAIADVICERLACGESLVTICESDGIPSKATVFRWLADDRYARFRDNYARARTRQADAIFDEIIAIADDSSRDVKIVDGEAVVDHEQVQRARLRIDARKWVAGKLAPSKYGESQRHEITGEGGGPIEIASNIGVALSAVRELRTLRGDAGLLPAPPEDHSDIL